MPASRPSGAGARVFTAAFLGAGVAWGALSYVALTIGVLTLGYRYSLPLATRLASVELGAMAVAAMSAGYMLRRVSVRSLATCGALLAGVANILTAFSSQALVVGATRALVGVGLGWMSAGLTTSLARTTRAERLFMRANFGCITVAAAFFYIMPMIYEHTALADYFIAYGVLCLASAGLMRWLPDGRADSPSMAAGSAAPAGRRLAMFLAVSLIWLCYAAAWALIERLGSDIGMNEEAIGRSMSLGTLSGLLGAGAAAFWAGRVRPLAPLIATSLSTGLCYLWLAFCRGQAEYTWLLCVWGVVFCPILAYAYAVGTEIDPSGGLGRMIGGGTAVTTALGPVVADRLYELAGFRGLGFATFAGSALACLAIAALAPRGERLSEATADSYHGH
jgi:hypothetical protein